MTATTGGSMRLPTLRRCRPGRSAGPAARCYIDSGVSWVAAARTVDDLVLRQRDQTLVGEVAVLAHRRVAGELGDELANARDDADMGVLDVEEQRARDRVLAVGDVLEGRRHALDRAALQLVDVLVEEAEAEDAERRRVGLELLDDQIVVLAGVDVDAVLADRSGRRPSWRRPRAPRSRGTPRRPCPSPARRRRRACRRSAAGRAPRSSRPGSAGLIWFQVVLGLATSLPSTGTSLASASQISFSDEGESGACCLLLASTMPSKPILTSVISVTPALAQASTSDFLIRREALVMSGWPRRRRRRTA